jgi:IgA Peptidase M64
VWGLVPPAIESGIARPSTGVHRASPLGASYDAFGSERYILTFENRKLREAAAFAPYEFMEILTNTRTYGGGGIFGLYSTVAADSDQAPYVFVHEFGHHMAALADEYYTSDVAYETGGEKPEPWEPNITANGTRPKWMELVTPGTPLPTPWDKEAYEAHQRDYQKERRALRESNVPEAKMDELFRRELLWSTNFLSKQQYANRVGAFEGASYEAKGLYRPEVDCIMFTRDEVGFCDVCTRAIHRMIDMYAK